MNKKMSAFVPAKLKNMLAQYAINTGTEPLHALETFLTVHYDNSFYFQMYEIAFKIASTVHAAQVDKGGHPYIDHPVEVSQAAISLASGLGYSPEECQACRIVALLHDVCEDSNLSLNDLMTRGFPPIIICAIAAITKKNAEKYKDYLMRVSQNKLALVVKMADLKHNMDLSRIPLPVEEDFNRVRKYQKALDYLHEHDLDFIND